MNRPMSRNRLTHGESGVRIADVRETPAMLAHNCDLLIKSIRQLLPTSFEYTFSTRKENLDQTLGFQYKLHELLSMWPKLVRIAGNPNSKDASTSKDLLKSVTSILDDYRDQLPSIKSIYYRPATENYPLANDLGILTAHSHTYLRTNQLGLQLAMTETFAWLGKNAAMKSHHPRLFSKAVASRIKNLTFRLKEADRLAEELRRELKNLHDRHDAHTSDRNTAEELDIDNDLESYKGDARRMRDCIRDLETAHDDADSAQRGRLQKAQTLLHQLRNNITAGKTGYDHLSAQLVDARAAIAHAYSPYGCGETSDKTLNDLESKCDNCESRLRTVHLALVLRPLMARYAPPDSNEWKKAYPDHALLFAKLKSLRAGVEAITVLHLDCCESGQEYLHYYAETLDNLTQDLITQELLSRPDLRRLLQSEFDDMNAKTRTTCTPKPNVKHLKLRLERLEAFVKANMSHAKHDDDEYKQWLDLRRQCLDLSSRLVVKKQLPKKQ